MLSPVCGLSVPVISGKYIDNGESLYLEGYEIRSRIFCNEFGNR